MELDNHFSIESLLGSSPNQKFDNGFFIDSDFLSSLTCSQPPNPDVTASSSILKLVGDMLMKEEDKPSMFHDCLALQAAEKSLYDIIGQDYHTQTQTTSHDPVPVPVFDFNLETILADYPNTLFDPDQDFSNKSPNGSMSNSNSKKSHRREDQEDEIERCFFPRKAKRAKKSCGEVIDLWTLLTQCSQSVSINDKRTSNQLLTQIRDHSSPRGDGLQRTAHYLANALEARLAGARTPPYSPLVSPATSPSETLKAYQLYVTACPFMRMSHFYANTMIMKCFNQKNPKNTKSKTLHIIDFGILYGYQWPCLIQRLSQLPEGPPKIRITGIEGELARDPDSDPGNRLKDYCTRFNVKFEYIAISKRWETIKYEDLIIDRSDVTVVNCLYRLKNIPDETLVTSSPRDKVLGLIRDIRPHIFVHGVVNGTYNAPFFVTRFKEALFHFSALFDMFEEASIGIEGEGEREVFEREIFGRDAMNAIACEGEERVERPETYRQWQGRSARAGLRARALDGELMGMVKERVRRGYHKDFVIHEDGPWMVQGWKGRLIYAISCWTPT